VNTVWKFRKSADGENGNREGRAHGRSVLIWIERILLVSGVALVGVFAAARIEAFLASRAALRQFAALETAAHIRGGTAAETAPSGDKLSASGQTNLPPVDFSLWGERRIRAYKQSGGEQSRIPLAVLRIPKIHLEAPLAEGTDDFTLNHSVGRIAGTARPGEVGNIGIAGHRDGFFRGLKDVVVGDAIELQTLKGTDVYIVDQIQIVKPTQVEVLQPRSVPSLTLVTCYPFFFLGSAPQRYIVMASLSREIHGEAGNLETNPPSTQ